MAPRQRMTPAVDRERQTISTFLLSRGNSSGPSTCALARSRRSCAPSVGGDPAPSCGPPDTSGFTKRLSRVARHERRAEEFPFWPGSSQSSSRAITAGAATKRKRSAGSAGRGGRSDSRESARPDPPSRRVLSWPDTGCRRSSGLSLGACRPAVMQLVPGGSDVAAIAAKRLSQGKAALPLHRCSLRTAASGSACQRRSRLAVRLVDRDTRQPRSIARRR